VRMEIGQRFRCQNSECAAEIEITRASIEGKSSITCCCGAVMKKPYRKPVLIGRAGNDSILAKRFSQAARVYQQAE